MDMNKFNISYSWTQPYLPTSYNPFYEKSNSNKHEQHVEVMNMLYDLECIDEQVNEMSTYPEAEAIIQKVRNGL